MWNMQIYSVCISICFGWRNRIHTVDRVCDQDDASCCDHDVYMFLFRIVCYKQILSDHGTVSDM